MNLAVVGLGYWGPNIVRNGVENRQITDVYIFDIDKKQVFDIKEKYRDVHTCSSYEEILKNPNIESVAIVTPVLTHYELSKKALEAGKNIIIEKPFTATSEEAEKLIELAEKNGATILIDHTFLYTSAVRKIKELIVNEELGDIYYYDSVRINLGMFQHDVNVIWDLAPHDFSIMDFLVNKFPTEVLAMGAAHIDCNGLENIAYVHLDFDDGMVAHFHLNWLSPVKIRKVLIGANRKMLEFDDLESADKIKVYDKGVKSEEKEEIYKTLVQYRTGDIYVPQIENIEALKVMMDHFIDCVENNKKPITDAESGLRVVKLLEASQKSIKSNGQKIKLNQ